MAVTLYWVAYQYISAVATPPPNAGQITSGLDSTAAAAPASGSVPYTAAATYDAASAITSLSPSTNYRVAWVAYDGASYSSVAVSGTITTGDLTSAGRIAGEFDVESAQLAGSVANDTVIRAASLDVKLAVETGKLQLTFGPGSSGGKRS